MSNDAEIEKQISQMEKHIEKLKPHLELRDLVLKLEMNRDFKKLILEEFCVNECARYAHLSADPNLNAQQRADAIGMAQAAGHLRRYLSTILLMGDRAEKDIKDNQEAIEEARQEGVS
jgi:hypothetical protein